MTDEPDNTSPDTITDDDGAVSIGDIADAVFDKIRNLIPGAGGDSAPPVVEALTAAPTEPAAAQSPPAPASVATDAVESAVERVLARKDTDSRLASVESKVSAPPEPKPKRTGIGALLFGADRP